MAGLLGDGRSAATATNPKVIESSTEVLYVPAAVVGTQAKRPLVVVLSPNGDAYTMIGTWQPVAERQRWILCASKEFRNDVPVSGVFERLLKRVEILAQNHPIDLTRVIASGISGGGMGSHTLAHYAPALIDAVVINTGMMSPTDKRPDYPRNKLAVFLASPTDFRYREMQSDEQFLRGRGWRTKWIEFEGGHTLAPDRVYLEAADWLEPQL